MKGLTLLIILALLPASVSNAGSILNPPPVNLQCLQVISLTPSNPLPHSELPARSGCCSWHGGVCGCSSSGRAVCCDGALSPSCGC